MKTTATALAALLALAAVDGLAAEEGKVDSPSARRKRIATLDREFSNSCALVRTWLRSDEDGEPPDFGIRYLCPNCCNYHTISASELLGDERPIEGAAFAVAPDRFLVQDVHLKSNWVERAEIVFEGEVYAARPVSRYPAEKAVEMRTERPVSGVRPLVFSRRIDFADDAGGVYYYRAREKGLDCRGMKPSALADFTRYADIGLDVSAAVANAIAVNSSNEAATVSFRSRFAHGRDSFEPPSEWKGEDPAFFDGRWAAAEREATMRALPVYIHLDDEDNRRNGFTRHYSRYRSDSDSTDLDMVGVLLPDGEVLVWLSLDASKMSEIDKIEATLPDGSKAPLEFVGAFADYKLAVLAFADGKTPAGCEPATLSARRVETRFLEDAWVAKAQNFNGKVRMRLARAELDEFRVIRGGEAAPVGDIYPRRGAVGALVFGDGTLGGIVADRRSGERYSGDNEFVSAARLAKLLGERDFDPQFAIRKGKDRIRVAWIGVETQRLTDDIARERRVTALLSAANTSGALVTRVWPGTPAVAAGLKEGDVLLTVRLAKSHRQVQLSDNDTSGGFDISDYFDSEDFGGGMFSSMGAVAPWPNVESGVNAEFTRLGIGKDVVVAYARDGERREAAMKLEQAPVHFQTAKRIKNKELGIKVADMTFEVRGYFKLGDDAPGVVVEKVQPGHPAAIAGVRPLEIITHVNGEPVMSAKDFAKKAKSSRTITFSIRRLAATRVVRIELKEQEKKEGEVKEAQK